MAAKVVEFCTSKRVHPSDIAVLVGSHKVGKEVVKEFEKHGMDPDHVFSDRQHKVSFELSNGGRIKVSTIHSFKGWESDVVFLIIPPAINGNMKIAFAVYVAITRARRQLVVINQNPLFAGFSASTA